MYLSCLAKLGMVQLLLIGGRAGSMEITENLEKNFRLLCVEVLSLVETTARFTENPTQNVYEEIISRDDYVDNLKSIIENECFAKIHAASNLSKNEVNTIRSIQIMSVNMERIADFCVNIIRQMYHLTAPLFLSQFDYQNMFTVIRKNMSRIFEIHEKSDLQGALTLCKSEALLDEMYEDQFKQIIRQLKNGRETENLLICLFVFRYLERIGDTLLNIGEALIFAIIGEKIKIRQYEALQQTLTKIGFNDPFAKIGFQSIWGSRSGCRLGRVSKNVLPQDVSRAGLYKEGPLRKIRAEKENIERWQVVSGNLVPRIYSYHEEEEEGNRGSLLVDYLAGLILEQAILFAADDVFRKALFTLTQTLSSLWDSTKNPGQHPAKFMAQLKSRLDSIAQAHPNLQSTTFDQQPTTANLRPATNGQHPNLCATNYRQPTTKALLPTKEFLSRMELLETAIKTPFSVFIHGDFNTNNIIYNHEKRCIHFVDLYRSCKGDYVQDVAVFLVSNFRMPIFEQPYRKRLNQANKHFFTFAKQFATERDDKTFEVRLALGLSRSFYTSTRFDTNTKFVAEMCNRAQFLLENILNHAGKPWEEFRLPQDILYY